MSGTLSLRWNIHRFGDGHMIKGVCATVAEHAGVPVWVPRAAFLVFGLLHWLLALVLYVVLARCLRPAIGRMAPRSTHQPSPAAYDGMRDRFGALDARLADLEAASLQQDYTLRRQFRDLER